MQAASWYCPDRDSTLRPRFGDWLGSDVVGCPIHLRHKCGCLHFQLCFQQRDLRGEKLNLD